MLATLELPVCFGFLHILLHTGGAPTGLGVLLLPLRGGVFGLSVRDHGFSV